MSFDPHTIEHLGIKMYSNIPNAVAELIANGYTSEKQRAFNLSLTLLWQGRDKSPYFVSDIYSSVLGKISRCRYVGNFVSRRMFLLLST